MLYQWNHKSRDTGPEVILKIDAEGRIQELKKVSRLFFKQFGLFFKN